MKADLEWKWIRGYENLYAVDVVGNVYSFKRSAVKVLKPLDSHGYLRVALSKDGVVKHRLIHRLVAMAFIPNPNNLPQVNHLDENKHNNHVNNLEWCDALYNTRYGTGIKRQSESRRGVPLSEERKRKISESCKGRKPPNHTVEGRRKMSLAAKKRWQVWRESQK